MLSAAMLVVLGGAFAGGFVSGLAGFGTGLVALGIWLHVLSPPTAATLVVVCSVVSQAQSIPAIWHAVDRNRIWPMLTSGLLGVPVGTRLLAHLDPAAFRLGMGVLLLAYSGFMLLSRVRTRMAWGGRIADSAVGFAGGVLGGLAGLSGPLPTVWATLRGWGKDERRGVFQAFNLAVLSAVAVAHAISGLMTADLGRLIVLALPGTLAGTWLGSLSYRRLRTCLSDPFARRSHFYSQEITRVRLAGRMGAEMWTEAHRARHEAGLKRMVSTCAVEEMARWLERADPPRSEKATPVLPVISAIAWHLRVGGPWRALPGDFPAWRTVYGWFRRWLELGLFDRLLCDVACLRRRAAGRKPEPSLGIIDTQSVKCIPVRGPRGHDAAKKVLGRKRVALVDADGTWLAVAVVPASTQERDTLPALDTGKAEWPSLREAILDGGFVAERCQDWSNRHGMRHRVVQRDPGQKGFVVLERRWVVERSFGWLAHWGGLLRDRAGRLDVSAARVAFAAVLSGVEALLNPMPIHAAAS